MAGSQEILSKGGVKISNGLSTPYSCNGLQGLGVGLTSCYVSMSMNRALGRDVFWAENVTDSEMAHATRKWQWWSKARVFLS